jgi:hypothetical protein
MRTDSVSFNNLIFFPDTLGGHRFVPRLWAKAKIDNIMELITIYGETDELVDQIIELSLRFQILTPYTAFYSDPTDNRLGIGDDHNVPQEFFVQQNYPNPFNQETVIRYNLPSDQNYYQVTIKIYDVLGRLILILHYDRQAPGAHKIIWAGRDIYGRSVPSGVYMYTIQAGPYTSTRKMILLK